MNSLTAEWIEKAEADFHSAQKEYRALKPPNYNAACFHAQQSAEKYMKALLQENEVLFPKTHNLIELLKLCLQINPIFELQRNLLERVDRCAELYRYPGISADKDEAHIVIKSLKTFRLFIRV